jgi:hypothetical protein
MIQSPTGFDAAFPGIGMTVRGVVAVIGALVLGAAATALAYTANNETPGSG